MNKNFRPIRCVSMLSGHPEMTIMNTEISSRCEGKPGDILGFPITGYDIDYDRLLVYTSRDHLGNHLPDNMRVTRVYGPDTEEYKKMCDYTNTLFGIMPYEEWEKTIKPNEFGWTFGEDIPRIRQVIRVKCPTCGCYFDTDYKGEEVQSLVVDCKFCKSYISYNELVKECVEE